jgi:hypothetical protein
MATSLPYGIRDIKITPYTDAAATTLAGSSLDLPNAQTLSFAESEDFEILRGDDGVVATRGKGAGVAWSLEAGGVSLAVVQAMYGGTLTVTGVSPNTVTRFRKLGTDTRPYFKAEGQAISDSGGDFHTVLYKCKCTDDFKGEHADGSFFITGAGGSAVPATLSAVVGALYDMIQNETAVAIP